MWGRLMAVWVLAVAPCTAAFGTEAGWSSWVTERRLAAWHDLPAELAKLQADAAEAQASGDLQAWARATGRRLFLLSEEGAAAAPRLAAEVAAALKAEPPATPSGTGRLSLLLGQVRFSMRMRDMASAQTALDSAQALADTLKQPAARAEVDVLRALVMVNEGDAVGALDLAQRTLQSAPDSLLAHEIFLGPQFLGRILGIHTPEAAQGLLADIDTRLAAIDAKAQPYLALNYGYAKAITLRRVRQPAQAREALEAALNAARTLPGFAEPSGMRLLEAGLARDLKAWPACIERAQALNTPDALVVTRVEALMNTSLCRAASGSAEARADLAALDAALPSLASSPGMLEAVLNNQATTYETLGDLPAAYAKLKAARQATLQRFVKANEAQRQKLQTVYEVAAKDKENAVLKAREQVLEQGRLELGLALGVAVLSLLVVAELLRRRSAQRRRLAQLAGQLETVNGELVAANSRLSELNASRTRLVAAACHDLRQPAHALGMLAEIAAQRVQGSQLTTVESIRRCSASLSDLLDRLFDLSRLESDHYQPEMACIVLGDLFNDLRTQFTVAAVRKGLSLRIDDAQILVVSDPHLLRRILMNLISNAIKYTTQGSVHVWAEVQGESVQLHVQDTGPGIPAEQQEAAFSEYVRLDSARGSDGLGIGLAIVKRSAELLGHGLALQSERGQGTRFTLTVPQAAGAAPPAEESHGPSGAGRVIALLEDDEQIRTAMGEFLRLQGYRVHAAGSLQEVEQQMAAAGDRRPALVISDFHLGLGDGLDILARMLAPGQPWEGVPALLITGDLDEAVLERCRALGITVAYKPLSPRKMMGLVEGLVGAERAVA